MSPALETVTPVVPAYPPPTLSVSKSTVAPFAVIDVALGKSTVAFLMVAVPVVAPKVRVDASPPILSVAAFVLKILADP